MSLHWWHVTISYVLVLGGFGALAVEAALRHARARRLLTSLEMRPRPPPSDRNAGKRMGAAGVPRP
jgi:hypothetical protein